MSGMFRRYRHETFARASALTLLPSVDPGQIGTGNPITGSRGESVTVTRATTRWCKTASDFSTVTSVAVDSPALEPEGLSIQAAHTNLLVRSEEFNNASWAKVGGGASAAPTVTANQGTAPDGTLTADRVQTNAISAAVDTSLVGQVWTGVASGNPTTFSIWVRGTSGSGSTRLILVCAGTIYGTLTVNFTTTWQRYTVTGTIPAGGTTSVNIGAYGLDTAPRPAADFLAWGAQLEASSYARSYRPTTSATDTTNQDIVTMSSSALPIARGSVSLEFTPLWSSSAAVTMLIETRPSLTPQSGIALFIQSNAITFQVGNDTANAATSSALSWTAGTTYRLRATWGDGAVAVYRDGALVASSAASAMPASHSTLRLGSHFLGTFPADGTMKNLRFYK